MKFTSGRTFTTSELRAATGYSAPSISRLALQGVFETVYPCKIGIDAVWPLEFYIWIKDHKAKMDERKKLMAKQKAEKNKEDKKSLEEMKKEHPLVTDERCFKLSFWPETVPVNLAEFMGE
jgi:hypothetical protein